MQNFAWSLLFPQSVKKSEFIQIQIFLSLNAYSPILIRKLCNMFHNQFYDK